MIKKPNLIRRKSQAWRCKPIIPALGRLAQEDGCEFETNLCPRAPRAIEQPCHIKTQGMGQWITVRSKISVILWRVLSSGGCCPLAGAALWRRHCSSPVSSALYPHQLAWLPGWSGARVCTRKLYLDTAGTDEGFYLSCLLSRHCGNWEQTEFHTGCRYLWGIWGT